jgi:hypothetical protein
VKRVLAFILANILLFSSVGRAGQETFSSVKLNSISVDTGKGFNNLRLVVKAQKAGNFEAIIDVKRAAQKSLEYFFISLVLHDDVFWVNLNPEEPNRIINSSLRDTDLGRIMLNADFRLKEDVSEYINPQTSQVGKEFWRQLYAKAQELGLVNRIPVITRLWIMPGKVEVDETENQISIVRSSLKVCLEPAYLSGQVAVQNKREQELQDFASSLMEKLVLPYLNKKVNEAYAYSDLREVFNALILARWYKDRFGSRYGSLLNTMDYRILDETETNYTTTPDELYQDYIKSLKEGKYSFTETETLGSSFGMVVTTKHYFSGGVDFRDIKMTRASSLLEEESNAAFFTCDLALPNRVEKPLQYAKSQMEFIPGDLLSIQKAPIMLARKLPAITPVRFSEQNIQSLNYIDRTERVLLSKL